MLSTSWAASVSSGRGRADLHHQVRRPLDVLLGEHSRALTADEQEIWFDHVEVGEHHVERGRVDLACRVTFQVRPDVAKQLATIP